MIKVLQQRRKTIALFFASLFMSELVTPTAVYALTSGPAQPEQQAFQPAGTSDMVDLFTGDFSYNIPLFELPGPNGGYPFNLAYQAGIGMDQEASWVGLGWSLNPGAINRQMRGLPDEFKGDKINTKMSVKPNITVGVGAGVGLEVFGADKGPSLSVGFSVYTNNYKGVGYSIDGSIGYSKAESGMAGTGVDLGISMDSKEGTSVNPSIGLGTAVGDFGLGVGYNSKQGLSNVSLSHSQTFATKAFGKKTDDKKQFRFQGSVSQSTSISLAHPGYTPQITMPMTSSNITATFKAGGSWWGVFGSPYVTGFYNEQRLKNDKKWVPAKAYGYLNYQHASSATALLDFNREKDGIITPKSPNLAIPSLSYDIYSVAGQGISAMYRPMRNDYGFVRDQQNISQSKGGSAGVDVGPASHVGVNLSINHSKSTSGAWTAGNGMASVMSFQKDSLDRLDQPWYFKVHGEPSIQRVGLLDSIMGDRAVRVKLTNSRPNFEATKELESSDKTVPARELPAPDLNRRPRNQVIQPITNEQLMKGGAELLSQFKVRYIDKNGDEKDYVRDWPAHHTAGFTALTPEGLRYVYGIPAYNLKQEEVTFSTGEPTTSGRAHVDRNLDDGDPHFDYDYTDQFLKRVEMPAYAHSFLLTSIIGPDYVDVDGNGVSEKDLGYWVKFTYKRTAEKGATKDPELGDTEVYKWREPFSGAHFQEGWKSDPADNRGSFVYGEKEIWYLARAETKSHVAEFETTQRDDAYGVALKLQDANNKGKALQKLQQVRLFTRSAGSMHPIKTVHFEYDYSLCKNVENNIVEGAGKLTLKKLWFEYGSSARGSLNPYTFKYHKEDNGPGYDINASDRWGTYKPYPANDPLHNQDFPYAEQRVEKEDEIHDNAAAWSLEEIHLPSGGTILVDYESDDYAYVQHKPAMQMTELVNPVPLYEPGTAPTYDLDYKNMKVRFRLEKPVSESEVSDQKAEVMKYLDQQRKQVYFKIKVKLRSPSETDYDEYIRGYADIDFNGPMQLEKMHPDSTSFHYGSFRVKPESGYHPFSMRAWQHLRTNQPEIANSGAKLKQTDNPKDRVKQIQGMSGIVADVRKMFGGYYKFCAGRDWGKQVTAGESWIRLNSVDKIKHGGGVRVRQITMKDEWSRDQEGVYGQVYEYRTIEQGKEISSGVAAYEPIIGGDENSLHYAKKYTESVPLLSDNNLFFEYPINESYYPGPQVGYRKVTVTSLAAASLAGKKVNHDIFPKKGEGVSYGTSGMTVHEFYTAKDFPVITDETEKVNRPYKLPLFIPFIGSINVSKLATSQGYSIVTNDMHGMPMKVSNYRQDRQGHIEPEPISWVKYNYACEQRFYEQEKIFTLLNQFKENPDGTLSLLEPGDKPKTKFTVGQENEFFADMREYEDQAWTGGVRLNIDFLFAVFAVIPVPVPWPSISKSTSQLRSAVTNKVIFKSGILQSTEAYDGGSLVKTSNLKWDKLTGTAVLTTVNNNFNDPVYSYSIPAYTQYQGMGAAYQNIGLRFSINGVQQDTYKNTMYQFDSPVIDKLLPGDEILVYGKAGKMVSPLARAIYVGEVNGRKMLYSEEALPEKEYRGLIVRSGYRNQLTVQAGTITALKDPTEKGDAVEFEKTFKIPE